MIFSIYLSVLGQGYAVGSVFALINDLTFRATVARSLFNWRVRGVGGPFFIICGAGQSGLALALALDKIGYRLVVIETQKERAANFELQEFAQPPLVLCGDARLPDVLDSSGIHSDDCEGLVALATRTMSTRRSRSGRARSIPRFGSSPAPSPRSPR
ncbi:MAG: NAD-binding protein [Burkholderiaceae bacterium]